MNKFYGLAHWLKKILRKNKETYLLQSIEQKFDLFMWCFIPNDRIGVHQIWILMKDGAWKKSGRDLTVAQNPTVTKKEKALEKSSTKTS